MPASIIQNQNLRGHFFAWVEAGSKRFLVPDQAAGSWSGIPQIITYSAAHVIGLATGSEVVRKCRGMPGVEGEHSPKRIWVLVTSKGGDNSQSIRLAKALRHDFVTRRLLFKPRFESLKPQVRASLDHINLQKSDPLSPPWPDLIIVTGRRPSMAALWVKERSGGRTKIALIGKPKGYFKEFDLIIAAAHYKLPEGQSNVVRIGLPMIKISADQLEIAREAWSSRLGMLRRPLTVLCFGGSTGARPLNSAAVRHIMHRAKKASPDGTLYILTSRRTPLAAQAEIKAQLPANGLFYGWQDQDSNNPYLGLLALGNRFIVTGDSISMLVEIARLGKPLAIAALPPEGGLKGLIKQLASRLGDRGSRDFNLLHRFLYDQGWAVPLGEDFMAPQAPPPDDSEEVAKRVKLLLSSG